MIAKLMGIESPSLYTDTLATWESYLNEIRSTADSDWHDPAAKGRSIKYAEEMIREIKANPLPGQTDKTSVSERAAKEKY